MPSVDAKVYVTNENPVLDYHSAEDFGELVFMTRADFAEHPASLHNVELVRSIRQNLKRFVAARDYVVITGSPIVSAAVFMILREKAGTIKILRWSNRDQSYLPVSINIEDKENGRTDQPISPK